MQAPETPAPSAPQDRANAPRWLPGYHWEYRTESGRWQNWTVVAAEVFNGQSAYHVRIDFHPHNPFGAARSDRWHDQKSLGVLAERSGNLRLDAFPAASQVFPLESRSYNITGRVGGYGSQVLRLEYVVGAVERLATPLGAQDGVAMTTRNTLNNETIQRAWYSFAFQNFLVYDENPGEGGDIYWLATWGSDMQPS